MQVLADAGYRSEAAMAELAITQPETELVIALGGEGKILAKPRDAQRHSHTVAMAAKFETGQGKMDYRKRKSAMLSRMQQPSQHQISADERARHNPDTLAPPIVNITLG